MLLTVVICTWNRCQLLRQALEQMTLLTIPHAVEWEVLIIDNDSTDATGAVIAEFTERLPVRRTVEAIPGLSHARNRAVSEARGRYILWTDDDVLVDPEWLAAYVSAFRQWPEAAFFGGPIRPHFAAAPPRWLEKSWSRIAEAYAVRELGDRPIALDGTSDLPFGANYAVRTIEQRGHRYDLRLGVRRKDRTGGEETQMMRQLIADGAQGRWVPEASVRHYVGPERMTLGYLRAYYIGLGKFLAKTRPRRPVRHTFRVIRGAAAFGLLRWCAPAETWMRHFVAACTAWGRLIG